MPAIYTVQKADAEQRAALLPISEEQANRLRWTGELPAVQYEDLSHYGDRQPVSGYCSSYPIMPQHGGGEVVIDRGIADGVIYEASRAHRVALIYLHEVAHRLTPGNHHGAVFASVCAALTLRATQSEDATKKAVGWYEVQDANDGEQGAALNHAIAFARMQMRSDASANDLPKLAAESWKTYRDGAWKSLRAEADNNAAAWIDIEVRLRLDAESEADIERNLRRNTENELASAIDANTLPWTHIYMCAIVALIIGILIGLELHR